MNAYQQINISKIRNEIESMNIFCHAHPLAAIRPVLKKRDIIRAVELCRMNTDDIVRLSGLLIIYHTPPTKSGKRVMFLTLEDETGLFDVVAFENVQKRFAKTILTSRILTLEGKLQRRGVNGKTISVIMGRAIPDLCGSLVSIFEKLQSQNRHQAL